MTTTATSEATEQQQPLTVDEVLRTLNQEEAPPEIDFNAPAPGQAPPKVQPGKEYRFRFHLLGTEPNASAENKTPAFDIVNIKGGRYLSINFVAEVLDATDPTQTLTTVRFQRANTYRSEKMNNSSAGELVRTLGLQQQFEEALASTSNANAAITQVLQANTGRVIGTAVFKWKRSFEDPNGQVEVKSGKNAGKRYTAYSTRPNTKGGELAWPRNGNGQFVEVVANPVSGEESYGNAEIDGFRLPKT